MNIFERGNQFTSSEARQICILLDRKIGLNSVAQLEISNQICAFGFYSHDYTEGLPNYDRWRGMASYNFDWLVDEGRIKIVDPNN